MPMKDARNWARRGAAQSSFSGVRERTIGAGEVQGRAPKLGDRAAGASSGAPLPAAAPRPADAQDELMTLLHATLEGRCSVLLRAVPPKSPDVPIIVQQLR